MNSIIYYKNFNFNLLTFHKHKYSDLRGGSPYNYVAYMLKGHSRIVSKDIMVEINEGDLFFIPEGLSYQSYWDSPDDIVFLSFGFHYFPEAKQKQFILQKIECDEEIKEAFRQIPVNNINSHTVGAFYSALSTFVDKMLFKPQDAKKELIEKATEYIYENINCSVSDIAKYLLISKSKLYDVFRKEEGTTPNDLIQRIRCKRAESLLATTDKSVQEISDRLGFSSTSYFRKVLKLHTGKTPLQIRKENKM